MVEVRVNGETFTNFKQIDGEYSFDTFAGEVRIICSEQPNDNSWLKEDDLIEVFLDGIQKFTGYVDEISDVESSDSHDISYTATDKVSDLIDSSVPSNVKNLEGVSTFKQLCQLVVDGLGLTDEIEVIDEVGASFGDSNAAKAAESGQNCLDFLLENARIVQVFLNTDGKGNILIRRPSGELQTVLQNVQGANNNNVKSSSIKINRRNRFYRYRVLSNSSVIDNSDGVDNVGEAFDNEVRKTRVFEKIAEKPMTEDECKKEAEEEANIRRTRSLNYTCEVSGFSANGELWEPGKLVAVKDPRKGMDGKYMLNTVKWSFSDNGESSTMDIVLPDKGTVEANATEITQRESEVSSTYTVVSGDTLTGISRKYGITLDSLVSANPQIENPNLIFPNQEINIPISGGN